MAGQRLLPAVWRRLRVVVGGVQRHLSSRLLSLRQQPVSARQLGSVLLQLRNQLSLQQPALPGQCQPNSWAAYYYSCGTSCHYRSQPCQVSVSPTAGQRITTAAGPAVTTAASRARSVSVLLQLRDQRHLKHGHWPQWPALPGQWRLCITVQYNKFQIIQIAIRFNLLHFRCSSHIG